MPRRPRPLPGHGSGPGPGPGRRNARTRGRAADMRCSRPASFAVLAGGRYCRATPLRARSARRTRRRIFAANTSPWHSRRMVASPARGAVRCAACAAAAAGIRAPAPHSAAPGLRSCCGRTHPRASLHRPARPAGEVRGGGAGRGAGTGAGGSRRCSVSGARVDAAAAHVRRVWFQPLRALPRTGRRPDSQRGAASLAGCTAAGAERRELRLCLATPHLRDDGWRPSRSSRSSPRPCGSSRVPRRSPRPASSTLALACAINVCGERGAGRPR